MIRSTTEYWYECSDEYLRQESALRVGAAINTLGAAINTLDPVERRHGPVMRSVGVFVFGDLPRTSRAHVYVASLHKYAAWTAVGLLVDCC